MILDGDEFRIEGLIEGDFRGFGLCDRLAANGDWRHLVNITLCTC